MLSEPQHSIIVQEWDNAAAAELRNHPHPPQCLFTDISGFLKAGLLYLLKDMHGGDKLKTTLLPLILKNKAVKPYLVLS